MIGKMTTLAVKDRALRHQPLDALTATEAPA